MSNQNFNWSKLLEKLSEFSKIEVDNYINYCRTMQTDKKRDGSFKNPFFLRLTENTLAFYFKKVKDEGLTIDGKHITINQHGISYDYVAYKQKMLIVYPNTLFDFQLVYQGDTFTFGKKDGKVHYTHKFANPFTQSDNTIIGGYCIIKNERGDFITILTKEDFQKHRKAAKTDYIWKAWLKEMCLKTLIKKAVKTHFDDLYESINDEDNKSVDLDKDKPKTSFTDIDNEKAKNRLVEFIQKTKSLTELEKVKNDVLQFDLVEMYQERLNELRLSKAA